MNINILWPLRFQLGETVDISIMFASSPNGKWQILCGEKAPFSAPGSPIEKKALGNRMDVGSLAPYG